MKHVRSYRLLIACFAMAFVLMVAGGAMGVRLAMDAGLLITAFGAAQAVMNCRCPNCRRWINPRRGMPMYCRHCGMKL